MNKIQAIFFDLGDTLVKTSSSINNEICRRIGEIRGRPLLVEEYTRASHEEWRRRSSSTATSKVKKIEFDAEEIERQYWRDYFGSLLSRLGISSEQAELIEWLVNTYIDPKSFVCFDEVHEVLSTLKEKGFILGIISNAFPSADKILDHLHLRQYFKYIFLSFELPYAKPESKIYQFAAEKANLAIEGIIFIDDRLSFVQGAEAVNMNAWLIDRPIDDPSITKPLVMKKIENLRELIWITNFSTNESVSNIKVQNPLPVHYQDNYCKLPAANPPTPIYKETNYAGRPTIPAYLSGLAKRRRVGTENSL